MKAEDLKINGKYNFIGQPEKLVFIGNNWSGNGYWNQFALIDKQNIVWSEINDSDLQFIEVTK